MSEQPIEHHPLEPFLPANCRVLFLGSFPPQRKRWARGFDFFFPNWINDHWRIEGLIWFGDKEHFVDAPNKTYRLAEIKLFLCEKGIGFYDTATDVRRLANNASDKFLEIVEATMKDIFETYLSLHPFINNWDLVDLSAYKIAGHYELMHPEITILDEWVCPEYTLWQRRISMVCTWIHIRHNKFDKAFARAEVLLTSNHDLLHKAAGWMLREIWKHNGCDQVEEFLEKHVAKMPSIMLSYTTELMPPQQREYWRQRRRGLPA